MTGLLAKDWQAGDWKAVAAYYRKLWMDTVDDVVDAEEELERQRATLVESLNAKRTFATAYVSAPLSPSRAAEQETYRQSATDELEG